MKSAPARLLIIAGSDSGGGAGLQADIKTATSLGVYASVAVTAVTVQDTRRVHAVHPVPASIVRDQIACVIDDIGADAIKIGMLGSSETVQAVAEILERAAQRIPVVLDPVLASTSGALLLDPDAISVLRERLFPLAALLTPNIPEAESLADMTICGIDDMLRAGENLRARGARSVLIKGGHLHGDDVVDVLVDAAATKTFHASRIESANTHGTGCTLSTAIACGLAGGMTLVGAIERARAFVQDAIRTAPDIGRGHGPLNHLFPCHSRTGGNPEEC